MLLQLQNITGERGWRVGKKCLCTFFFFFFFLADQKIVSSWEKKMRFGGIL